MKKIYKLFYIFLSVIAVSCTSDINEAVLLASFEHEPNEIYIDTKINFTNTSKGISSNTSYLWNFGDGTTSTNKNPSHTYTKLGLGTYTVTLTLNEGNKQEKTQKEFTLFLSNDIKGRKSLLEKLSDNKILVCAHRAIDKDKTSYFPENSLAAINDAIKRGFDMIEIDVRETEDAQLVLMHDKTINRTTNGSGMLNSFSLKKIQTFKLYNNNNVLTNEKIPSLKEVFAIARGNIYINLDISKDDSYLKIYPYVKQYGMIKQVMFYSPKLDVIKFLLNKNPDLLTMPIIDGNARFSNYEIINNIKIVHYTDDSFNQTLIDKAKAKGWFIYMNAYLNTSTVPSVDNYARINTIRRLAGNIISTDHPNLVKIHLTN